MKDHISYRYQMIDHLGRGSFGQAIKCFDHKTKEYCCIKIIKNQPRFFKQGLVEIGVLDYTTSNDAPGIVKMLDNFVFRNHLCIKFEILGINLYDLIKRNDYEGLSFNLVRTFTK